MKLDSVIAAADNKTLYRSDDACVKVFGEEYSKADVIGEALNQAKIESTDIKVPQVRQVTTIDGKWAIVSDYIEGKTLAEMIEEDPDNKDKYIEKLIDVQLEMQSNTCRNLDRLKDRMNNLILKSDLDATTRYDLHSKLDDMPNHHKVCHGNFTASQVIITDDGTAYILGWANATQGNASADAASTYLNFRISGDVEGAKKYLDMFCQKSDIARRYILKWMAIVAAAMSVNCNEEDKEKLITMIDKSDFE